MSLTLAGALVLLACDGDQDETAIVRGGSGGAAGTGGAPGGSGGGGSGGTSGSGPGGSDSGGSDSGGSAGSAGRDAGGDVGPDLTGCVLGTLEQYCSLGATACPALADARAKLEAGYALQALIQRPCVAPDGAARISVSGAYISFIQTYIYDAQTLELVGVHRTSDVGSCFERPAFGELDFGEGPGFYGEESPDCGPDDSRLVIPPACDQSDAGVEDAGADAGPYVCILGP